MSGMRGRTQTRWPPALARAAPGRALVVAVLALALGFVTSAGAASVDSGIAGVVRGGDCTLARGGRSCPGRLPVATIEVYREVGGPPVATARLGPLGTFRVSLVPGRYVLRLSSSGARQAADRTVHVRPHAYTVVVIQRGSRIR